MHKTVLAVLAVATFSMICAGPAANAAAQSNAAPIQDASQVIRIGDFNNLIHAATQFGGQLRLLSRLPTGPVKPDVMGVNIPDQGSILIGGLTRQAIPGSELLIQAGDALAFWIPWMTARM